MGGYIPKISVKHLDTHLGRWIGKNVTPAASYMSKMEFPLLCLPPTLPCRLGVRQSKTQPLEKSSAVFNTPLL